MTTLAVTFFIWFGVFLAYFALAFIAAVLIGKALSLNTRLETLAERRETDGPLSALREENGAKVARANFRHATRHSKDVA